jgi:hypothetical protein
MNPRLANGLGWYGAIAFLVGYALISFGLLPAESILYQSIVLTAAIGLVIISTTKKVFQTVLLNGLTAAIALAAILNIIAHS